MASGIVNFYNNIASGETTAVLGTAGNTYNAGYNIFSGNTYSNYTKASTSKESTVAEIDEYGVPRANGNCDWGQGDWNRVTGIGHLDCWGRPKLRPQENVIGCVFPQRESPLNLAKPHVKFPTEVT